MFQQGRGNLCSGRSRAPFPGDAAVPLLSGPAPPWGRGEADWLAARSRLQVLAGK